MVIVVRIGNTMQFWAAV